MLNLDNIVSTKGSYVHVYEQYNFEIWPNLSKKIKKVKKTCPILCVPPVYVEIWSKCKEMSNILPSTLSDIDPDLDQLCAPGDYISLNNMLNDVKYGQKCQFGL